MTDKNHTKFEEKELRFRQTLSALPDGVVLLRKDLVIQWMNRIAERDLSLDPEKDVTVEFKSEPTEVVALLKAQPEAVAMLPLPVL